MKVAGALLKWAATAVIGALVCFTVALVGAQFAVWGLSLLHVHSGIWGPYLILSGISMVVTTTAAVSNSK
jgi:hypothetical protein